MAEASAAAVISHLRRRRGHSARAASALAGQSPSYVSKLESGEVEPSLRAFARLVVALRMTPAEAWVVLMHEAHSHALTVTPPAYRESAS